MSLSANRISMYRRRLYIPVQHFQGYTGAHVPVGAGTPTIAEFKATGLVGLLMGTNGDDIHHLMAIPDEWDRQQPIYVRVLWASESETAADTVDWTFQYRPFQGGDDRITSHVQDLDVAASVALGTVIPQDLVLGGSPSTVEVLQRTQPGIIHPGALVPSTTATPDLYMHFRVEMTTKAAGLTETLMMFGVEFEFSPKYYPGITSEALAWEQR